MIVHIRGVVSEVTLGTVVLDVQGVGYEVAVSAPDIEGLTLGQEIKMHTVHVVREQSEELFGFLEKEGKKLFELLTTVQGVGPKAALALLSIASTSEVKSAIANRDSVFLAKAQGVGKKTAERIAVDLAEKVGGIQGVYQHYHAPIVAIVDDEAQEALLALGFTREVAAEMLTGVDESLSVEERISLALKKK